MAMQMRLRRTSRCAGVKLAFRQYHVLRVPQAQRHIGEETDARTIDYPCLQSVAEHDAPLLRSIESSLPKLRRARHHGLRTMARLCGILCRHGGTSYGQVAGSARQQPWIFTAQLSVGDQKRTDEQQARQRACDHRRRDANRGAVGGTIRNTGCSNSRPQADWLGRQQITAAQKGGGLNGHADRLVRLEWATEALA